MKKTLLIIIIVTSIIGKLRSQESYRALNVGLGVGYYGIAPAVNVNYEFDLFRNFTLAPFASLITYRNYRYWGSDAYPYKNYYYRETIIPIGAKGSYYFDELFEAGERWDFYAAASLGVAFRTIRWDSGYHGDDVTVRRYSSPLYGNLHIGTEYHMSQKAGLFLDLSTGMSTLGVGFHF